MLEEVGEAKEEAQALLERILIVDEDAASIAETKAVLESRGFKVTIAKDGGQAHGLIRTNCPDLVLMQVILPGESGFEICERMKQQLEKLPVVILTEIDLDSARNLAQRVGADGYVTKPYDPEILEQIMRQSANAVMQRMQDYEKKGETGVIRFHCRCGKRIKEKYEYRGKSITCPGCQDRVQVPNQSIHEFFTHEAVKDDSAHDELQPLKFVTIKCQHCATFYRLSATGSDLRNCPRCKKSQSGPLSIVGAPISRAALESSLRVLRVVNGKNKGKKLLLPKIEITFGQAQDCVLRHNSKYISEHHCTLKPTPQGVVVTDLGSQYGTYIDEERLTNNEPTLLRGGSVLQVGDLKFRLIGEDTTMDDEMNRVQTWSAKQDEAKQKGINLIEAGQHTASEAAQVIQQYWNIDRQKRSANEVGTT